MSKAKESTDMGKRQKRSRLSMKVEPAATVAILAATSTKKARSEALNTFNRWET